MPIETDTAWPAHLIRCIDRAHAKDPRNKSRYNGAYSTLLSYCFSVLDWTGYVVAPDTTGDDDDDDDDDGGPLNFLVLHVSFSDPQDRPVMMVRVQEDQWLEQSETRLSADERIRDRFKALFAECSISIPTLYGLSIMGTKMHIYRGDVATGEIAPAPAQVPRPAADAPPADFLADWWAVDIRSQDAFDMLKLVVMDIANEIAKLS